MSSVAIITARGGSKRIPKKNIRDFLGKPIIAYSISAALKSGIFDEVMVSTDSEEIAEVAKKFGAQVPFMRSEKNSDDYATTADVLYEVLNAYGKRGKFFDLMCCIYPTAPFVTSKKLIDAVTYLKENGCDALTPVVKFSYPPQRGFVVVDGFLQYKWRENINKRSQDLEPLYHDAGQFYIYDVHAFLNDYESQIGGGSLRTIPMLIDELEVQDIDNLSDWELAETKYSILRDKGKLKF